LVLVIALALIAGCGGNDGEFVSPLDPAVLPMPGGNLYRPTVATTWQWQIQGTVNTSYDVELYDIDLFDVDASLISQLQGAGRRVICYFSAGSAEDFRSDFDQFEPRDLGKALDGFANELYVDVRSANVHNIMLARLDLAVDKGCDGVEPDNVQSFELDTGLSFDATDQLAFNRFIANESHARGLSVGLKNGNTQASQLVDYYDFELNEQCHEFGECDVFNVFLAAGKPVLNAEYRATLAEAQAETALCAQAVGENIRTLILPLDLDDSFRVSCEP